MLLCVGMLRDLPGGTLENLTCIEILLVSYFDSDKSSDSHQVVNIIKGHEVIHLCFTVFFYLKQVPSSVRNPTIPLAK